MCDISWFVRGGWFSLRAPSIDEFQQIPGDLKKWPDAICYGKMSKKLMGMLQTFFCRLRLA